MAMIRPGHVACECHGDSPGHQLAGCGGAGVSVVLAAVVVMVRRNGADLAALVIRLTRSALVVSAGWLLLASSWSMSDGLSPMAVGQQAGHRRLRRCRLPRR